MISEYNSMNRNYGNKIESKIATELRKLSYIDYLKSEY